jgi:hypothetical protein
VTDQRGGGEEAPVDAGPAPLAGPVGAVVEAAERNVDVAELTFDHFEHGQVGRHLLARLLSVTVPHATTVAVVIRIGEDPGTPYIRGMTDTVTPAPERDELPRWDTTALFSGLDGRDYARRREALDADVDRLAALYERHDVRGGPPRQPTPADHAALDEVLTATNALLEDLYGIGGFVAALITTDADDDAATAEDARRRRWMCSAPGVPVGRTSDE